MKSFKVLAPTRVDLAGGTLDLWPLYCLVGGASTINAAINLFASVEVRSKPHSRFELELNGAATGVLLQPLSAADLSSVAPPIRFPLYVVSQFLHELKKLPKSRITLSLSHKAPAGSGLGGSTAIAVALTKSMGELFGRFRKGAWQWDLLAWVRDVEAAYLKLPTGTQDALAALFGGLGCYTSVLGKIEHHPFPKSLGKALSDRMVVIFSGESHESGLSNWEVYQRALGGDAQVLGGMVALKQVTSDLKAQLSKARPDWNAVGQCFDREWEIRKSIFKVDTETLNEAIQLVKDNGAWGAKVCGAAQGGSLLALVDPKKRQSLITACEGHSLEVLPAQVSASGLQLTRKG